MSEVIPFDKTQVSTALAKLIGGEDANDDLSSGVSGGFSVVSFRGSKWRVKHGGEETLLVDSEGEAMPSIRVVILKGNKHISKNYYAEGYVEGSTDTPSCWSIDGDKPDSAVEKPISTSCLSCPFNQFGSRITESGSKAKKCGDSRRIAVVPEGDFANKQFDGPMLLRVPAASLSELASFAKGMKAKGFPYNTIVTKISFDPDTSYPKLRFKAVRPVTADEADEIINLLRQEEYAQKLDFILAKPVEVDVPAASTTDAAKDESDPTEFEEPPAKPAAKKTSPPRKPVAVKAVKEVEQEEEEAEEAENDSALTDELEDILAKLDDLE